MVYAMDFATERTYTTTELAKELDMGSARRFREWLVAHGVMRREGELWVLTDAYKGRGLTRVKESRYWKASGQPGVSIITVWTERGRRWLRGLVDSLGEKGLFD